MRNLAVAALLGTMLVFPAPLLADDRSPPSVQEDLEEAEQMARESMEKLLGVLKRLLYAIPQYEAPEILENGDIIIRRVPRHRPDGSAPKKNEGEPADPKWL